MAYIGVSLSESIHIDQLFTVHYFEYSSDFIFSGESHDFWEFVYVDKGEIQVTADSQSYLLRRGEILFHKPNEFHSLAATGTIAPNLIVVSFSSSSIAMQRFENQKFTIDETERNLLAEIIVEAQHCFSDRLDDPFLTHMNKKNEGRFAAEQMLRLYLEHFLIHLVRRCLNSTSSDIRFAPLIKSTKIHSDHDVFEHIVGYMERHLDQALRLDKICRDNLIGRSQLHRIFHSQVGHGAIDHFSMMKIESAKQMIRNEQLNFTQISQKLGYSSIHYFSRQFKKLTQMTPSEYALSVKAISETVLDQKEGRIK